LIGIIFLALGISLAVVWSASIVVVLKGIIPLLLFFLGAVFLLVGYSERKASREYAASTEDEGTQATGGSTPSEAAEAPKEN